MNPTIRVSDPAGLLAAIPELIGFLPERSLVVVFLIEGRVALTMRGDLDQVDRSWKPVDQTVEVARQHEADAVVLVAYDDELDDHLDQMLVIVASRIETRSVAAHWRVHVRAAMAVGTDARRWRFVLGQDGERMPPVARTYDEVAYHAISAGRVYAGKVLAGGRDEVAARVQPGSETPSDLFTLSVEAAVLALGQLSDEEAVALMVEDLAAIEDSPDAVDDTALGRLVGLLANGPARDAAMLRLNRENAARFLDVWSRAVRLTTGRPCLAALFLSGTAAWLQGDGVLVNACVEAGQRIDDRHIGVLVLDHVSQNALAPSVFEEMRVEMLKQLSG